VTTEKQAAGHIKNGKKLRVLYTDFEWRDK